MSRPFPRTILATLTSVAACTLTTGCQSTPPVADLYFIGGVGQSEAESGAE